MDLRAPLTPKSRELFPRLSVFSGGCILEAAEEICAADVDTLQSLVEKSLLRFTEGRYWMLETIREYAVERLEEAGEANARQMASRRALRRVGPTARSSTLPAAHCRRTGCTSSTPSVRTYAMP